MKNLNNQTYLQLMESGYINFSPRYASIIRCGCVKTIVKEQKARETVSYDLFLNSDWPIVKVLVTKLKKGTGKFCKNEVLSKIKMLIMRLAKLQCHNYINACRINPSPAKKKCI